MNGGAFVLPIVHDVIRSMNTLRLQVSRGRDKALITRDCMRVDVVSEFYVRVQAAAAAIASAAQTLASAPPSRRRQGAAGRQVRRCAPDRGGRDDHGGLTRRGNISAGCAAPWPRTCCRTGSS
jgi:hypothetical protein